MDSEMVTQTEDIILRFRTSKPLGLLLISSTVETGDRIELAVAAGRIRLALRLDVKEKRKEDREKDKVGLRFMNCYGIKVENVIYVFFLFISYIFSCCNKIKFVYDILCT